MDDPERETIRLFISVILLNFSSSHQSRNSSINPHPIQTIDCDKVGTVNFIHLLNFLLAKFFAITFWFPFHQGYALDARVLYPYVCSSLDILSRFVKEHHFSFTSINSPSARLERRSRIRLRQTSSDLKVDKSSSKLSSFHLFFSSTFLMLMNLTHSLTNYSVPLSPYVLKCVYAYFSRLSFLCTNLNRGFE